ncbi:MAG: hypothetical protein WC310_04315 [Patescibacteria group bacterium]|jgi:hypothetical protein
MSSKKQKQNRDKAWVIAVNMGYGHQRAAYPFKSIAKDGIIIANDYPGIPRSDKRKWEGSRAFYELVSRAKQIPIIGETIFDFYDNAFQKIENFYPKRDLSAPNFQLRQIYRMIKNGWGEDLIKILNQKSELPLLTSFFVPAFFAEEHGYKGEVYCMLCDADISRVWAPLIPQKTRIKYLASNTRVAERLKLYGVPAKNIILTGFPLPKENIGGRDMSILKKDLWERVHHLDPKHTFINKYHQSLVRYIDHDGNKSFKSKLLTLTFAVGGAGAQRDLGLVILKSLEKDLFEQKIKINLVAGVRNDVYCFFKKYIEKTKLKKLLGKNVNIIYAPDKNAYFEKFNQLLRDTDILWTKPSELAFYAGLGIPIIMAPPIGSQEKFNQRWLETIGGGLDQLDPKYTHQWLFDWIYSGWLAEAAFEGFLDAPKFGTYRIEQIIFKRETKEEKGVVLL